MTSVRPTRRPVAESETLAANRADWDRYSDEYQATHGAFLGDAGFVWSPEGLREMDVHVLGEVSRRRILEVGCGAAQCSRWLLARDARAFGLDVSLRQLQHAARIDAELGTSVPVVCATATALPFAAGSFDVVFAAFGALQFVASADSAVAEVARVLCGGGRFAFSVTHPFRWSMPDDPSIDGLVVTSSYFYRTPYVEEDEAGAPAYVEHHRTVGDWVRTLARHGFVLVDLLEPEWPEGHDRIWGGWGPERGRLVPGTALFVADLPR
ncbi:MAG: class I SAM-dependent methyltransferase [Nocardioidaceae bacterium]